MKYVSCNIWNTFLLKHYSLPEVQIYLGVLYFYLSNMVALEVSPMAWESWHFLFFIFWPSLVACGILVPQQGIKPSPPTLEGWSLNHWTTTEVPTQLLKLQMYPKEIINQSEIACDGTNLGNGFQKWARKWSTLCIVSW